MSFGIASFAQDPFAGSTFIRAPWERIENDQTPGWADILPSLTINDVATFGGLSFGDVSFSGQYINAWVPDTVRWTEVVNNQTPGWIEVQ